MCGISIVWKDVLSMTGISGCPKTFTNQQGFCCHVKQNKDIIGHMIYFKNQTSLSVNDQENDTGAESHNRGISTRVA